MSVIALQRVNFKDLNDYARQSTGVARDPQQTRKVWQELAGGQSSKTTNRSRIVRESFREAFKSDWMNTGTCFFTYV